MVRSNTVMVLMDYLPKKSLVVVVSAECWWQTKFNVGPGPGLWPLDLLDLKLDVFTGQALGAPDLLNFKVRLGEGQMLVRCLSKG